MPEGEVGDQRETWKSTVKTRRTESPCAPRSRPLDSALQQPIPPRPYSPLAWRMASSMLRLPSFTMFMSRMRCASPFFRTRTLFSASAWRMASSAEMLPSCTILQQRARE